MNVYIGGTKDYSAMQGPCDAGFHIPNYDEINGLYNIVKTTLGNTTRDLFMSKLHLPATGYLSSSSGELVGGGNFTYYQCVTGRINGTAYVHYSLDIDTFNVNISNAIGNQTGGPIRPFKDGFVTPDNTWTVIQGTLGSAGIFRDENNGLISITGDGTTGYTISDKNLGATVVWNSGDALSESNCGKFYQRGNNYGFSYTGATTISSTQIDASSYGPGNYYSSSTFITASPRDSSHNFNLRGGETGIISPAELKNAYIGNGLS